MTYPQSNLSNRILNKKSIRMMRLWVIQLAVLIVSVFVGASAVFAQSPTITWSEPQNISNSAVSSRNSSIVADMYGNVHLFWSEDVGGKVIAEDENPGPGNTILYRQWNGTQWSTPIDIFYIPGEPLADFPKAVIGSDKRIHLVWTGLTNIYYTSVPVHLSTSAQQWREPIILSREGARTRFESDIAVDKSGGIHVAFATRGTLPAIEYVNSQDGGISWSTAERISLPLASNEGAFSTVSLLIDQQQNLHAVWQSVNRAGFGQAIYYGRRSNDGTQWDVTVLHSTTIDNAFVGWPILFESQDGLLTVIYSREISKGRLQRISADFGLTWSEEQLIVAEMMGINGYVFPLEDAENNIHLIINMRRQVGQQTGIYYSMENEEQQSLFVEPVVLSKPSAPYAHYADGTVRLGNELHVTWTQNRGGEIWHVVGKIDGIAPEVMFIMPPSLNMDKEREIVVGSPIIQPSPEESAIPAPHIFEDIPKTNSLPPFFLTLVVSLLTIVVGILVYQKII